MLLKICHLLSLNKETTHGYRTICSTVIVCSMNEYSVLLILRIPVFVSITINGIYRATVF